MRYGNECLPKKEGMYDLKSILFMPVISLKFIRLLRVVFSTEGVITTRSNRMKFRLACNGPSIKFCVQYLNILSCEIR